MAKTTTTSQVDPWVRDRQKELWSRGQALADRPFESYPGSRVAGFAPMQMSAFDYLTQNFGNGTPGMAEAQQAAGIAGGIAQGGMAPQIQTGNVAGGMAAYRDPYEDQVVGAAMSDIDRQRLLAQQGNASVATQSGAFGGDRHAILEAETNRGFGDVAARTAAQLRSQGFNRAADLAQQDASRGLQGDMANQNAFFMGRGQQLQGAGLLSQFGGDMFDRTAGTAGILSQGGAVQQGQAQAELDDSVARFDEERAYGWDQLGNQQALLEGFPVGMTQSTSTPFNWGSAAMGAGLLGLSAWNPGGRFGGMQPSIPPFGFTGGYSPGLPRY